MRVPDKLLFESASLSQQRQAERLDKAARVASSGVKVETPSDDPSAWVDGVRLRAQATATGERRQIATRAQGDLELADGALSSANDRLVRARELAVQMANGSMDAADRAAAAKEIDAIREDLIGLANTRGDRGYLFGGTAITDPPFSSAGVFSGNDLPFTIPLAEGTSTNVAPSGAHAFTTAGGRDPFADLATLSTALKANDVATVTKSIDQLAAAQRQIIDVRSDTGMALSRLQNAVEVGREAETRLKSMRADRVEPDAIDAIGELQQAQSAFERGIDVTKKVLALSSLQR